MSERVVFRPVGVDGAIPFAELGHAPAGAWGLVDDQAWLAAPDDGADALELLFLTRADYLHAVRELSPGDVAQVVDYRRTTFAVQVPSIALGLVELRVRECIGSLDESDVGTRLRGDLLTALASFTTVPRFAGTAIPKLLDDLREGDARIIAELESPSLRAAGDLDPSGDERATRRRFATDVGQLAARRGRPEKARVLPYFALRVDGCGKQGSWRRPRIPSTSRRCIFEAGSSCRSPSEASARSKQTGIAQRWYSRRGASSWAHRPG